MIKYCYILIGCLILYSCGEVQKPKDLIPKEIMASIMVDTALYDNLQYRPKQVAPKEVSLFILEKHQVTGKQYGESYKYYVAKEEIPDIVALAKQKLLTMDPELKGFIDKKRHKKQTKESVED